MPTPLTPLRTPSRSNEEEVVLELHPSPLPLLEEPTLPTCANGEKLSSNHTEQKRREPSRKRSVASVVATPVSGSQKENTKRPGDSDGASAKKKSKDSRIEPPTRRRPDPTKCKIPFRPIQDQVPHFNSRPEHSVPTKMRDEGRSQRSDEHHRGTPRATERRRWNQPS